MISYNASVTDERVDFVGRDTLARFGLNANERGAVIEAEAISAAGERRAAKGVGFMVPEEGWLLHAAADPGCSLTLSDATHVDFAVNDSEGWMLHVSVSFTQNYAVS